MRSPLPLLLLAAAAAGATTVEVRFTADFSYAVTSTSSTSCRGGAYRAHALTAAAGLRIDGGGVAAACGASTTCAQVFAAMGYDGWALNAADIASGSLQTFQGNVGSKPVASNYAQSYTSKFADVGGALLLAVAEGGTTTYRQAVDVALAEARDAGVDFGTTPVILCVSGISTADISDLGGSSAADAVEKLAKETTDVDLVIATGIAGLSTAGFSTLTNWAGDVVFLVAPAASSTVQTMALGFANDGTGAPSSLNRGSQSCSSSNYDEFIYRIINDHVDFVQIGMLCDAGMGGREECDAGRAAFEAINNKNDGIFDDVLTSTKLEVTVATFDGNNCGESLGASARTAWQNDLAAANPVAVVGPGGTTCVKSVASNSNRQTLAGYGLRDDAVVMSESSTATVASDRSTYPNLVRLASTEDTVSQGVLAVVQKYGWQRVAIVYDATDSWAADTARVLSENLGNARIATLGDKCVSRSCTTTESKSDHRGPKKGIRFDKEDAHWVNTLMTTDVADQILDELVALDAKIIYLMITPADTKVIFERIYQTKKCFGVGYAYFTGWASDDIFLEADGSASTDAAYGAQGLLTVKERVDTSGSLGQALIAHREAGLDKETCTGDEYIAGEYCDNDDDATSLAGYGPQVVDAVITLANALDSLSATNRQLPDKIYEAIGDVGRAGFEGYSGTVVLDTYNERVGSMEVRNYQLKEKAITGQRRLAVDLTSIALSDEVVATIVGGQFVPEAGTEIIFPGGTTKVPLDHTPEDDDEARMDTGLAVGLGCGFGALILLMAGVWYHHSKKLNKDLAKVRADLQDFKDSVVGVKVAVRDYVPKAVSTGDAGTAAANAVEGATWYWKETEANITRHDVALVKPPCWVAYPPDVQRQLEQAFESNLPRVQTGPNYSVDLGSMQQVNARSGFKRDVLRDVAAAQKSTRPSEKANTEVRPDELLGEDALLLRKGSMIQIKDQRKDGWAYGTVVLNKGDESKDRRFLEDGISLSAGWFPLGCTDVPSGRSIGGAPEAARRRGRLGARSAEVLGPGQGPADGGVLPAAARKRGVPARVQRHQPDDGAAAAQDPLHRAGPEH